MPKQAAHLTQAADAFARADAAIKAAEKEKEAAREVFLKDGRDVFYTSDNRPITRRDAERGGYDIKSATADAKIAAALEPFKTLSKYATFSVSKRATADA